MGFRNKFAVIYKNSVKRATSFIFGVGINLNHAGNILLKSLKIFYTRIRLFWIHNTLRSKISKYLHTAFLLINKTLKRVQSYKKTRQETILNVGRYLQEYSSGFKADENQIKELAETKERVLKETESKLSKIDRQILEIQRSTKTTIPQFEKLHNYFRMKYQWYYRWHINPYSKIVHTALFVLVFAAASWFSFIPSFQQRAFAAVVTWTGAGTDGTCGGAGTANNWSCGANWSTGVKPTASDIATFDGTSGGDYNKSVTINENTSVAGIDIKATYTGTITQAATRTLTVGASNYVQAGGTFQGGNSAITINGSFTLSGGSFTSTSNTLTINNGNWAHSNGSFVHNSGTVVINANNYNITVPLTETFNDLTVTGIDTNRTITIASGNTLIVTGTFNHSSVSLNSGTVSVRGNVIIGAGGGSTTLLFEGSGDQSITSTNGSTKE